MIVGPVLIFCGISLMLFSIEVIIRLNKNAKRVQDPEIDVITNLHHIKHWMDPGLLKNKSLSHKVHWNANGIWLPSWTPEETSQRSCLMHYGKWSGFRSTFNSHEVLSNYLTGLMYLQLKKLSDVILYSWNWRKITKKEVLSAFCVYILILQDHGDQNKYKNTVLTIL